MASSRFRHWPPPSDDLRTLQLRIPTSKIGFVSSLVESYEGVAVMRTVDRQAGIIDLWAMPGRLPDLEAMLQTLQQHFSILRIRETPGHPDLSLEEEGSDP